MTDFDEIEAIGADMIHRVCRQMIAFCTPHDMGKMDEEDIENIEFVHSFLEWADLIISEADQPPNQLTSR